MDYGGIKPGQSNGSARNGVQSETSEDGNHDGWSTLYMWFVHIIPDAGELKFTLSLGYSDTKLFVTFLEFMEVIFEI